MQRCHLLNYHQRVLNIWSKSAKKMSKKITHYCLKKYVWCGLWMLLPYLRYSWSWIFFKSWGIIWNLKGFTLQSLIWGPNYLPHFFRKAASIQQAKNQGSSKYKMQSRIYFNYISQKNIKGILHIKCQLVEFWDWSQ